jgi:signal peptidase I
MSGSGGRDGASPPWGPADPVPELSDTQALPGLGAAPDQNGPQGSDSGESRGGTDGADPDAGAEQDLQAEPKFGKRRRSFWRELPVLVVIAVVLALLIKSFVIQAFYIPSASMENTLEIGDRVLINKVVYHLRSIHRGDIIVFDGTGSWDFNTPPDSSNIVSKAVDELEGIVGVSHDSSIYIKRVIGLPGDHVACCNSKGQVTVNGVPLSESSYVHPGDAPSAQKFSITVPAGRLWVMGDNRTVSYDSRGHMGDPGGGTIPESGVLGRAFVIIWPPSRWGFLNIPATFEQPQLNASAAAAGGSSAALEAALDNGTPVHPATSPLPLALGFAGAVPLTWLQRRVRQRRRRRRAERRP